MESWMKKEEHQLILEGSSPREDLLKKYNKVDISLDPFPYSGGTTNFETLAVLAPNASEPNATFASATVTGTLTALNIKSGSFSHSASLDPTSDKYVEKVFSKS